MISDGIAVQTSKQLRQRLLCDPCEQRFGKDEDYVSRLAYKTDDTLGLLDLVPADKVFSTRNRGFSVRGAAISHLDCQSIARFSASMFWRYRVSNGFKGSGFRLWSTHAEHLRLFLLEGKPLPTAMCIALFVLADDEEFSSVHSGTFVTPTTGKNGSTAMHWFVAFGLVFVLMTEKAFPHVCVACDPAPHAVFATWEAFKFMNELTDAIAASQRKGSIAKVPRS